MSLEKVKREIQASPAAGLKDLDAALLFADQLNFLVAQQIQRCQCMADFLDI